MNYKIIITLILFSICIPQKKSTDIQREIDSTNKNLETIKKEIINVENEITKIINQEKDNNKIIKAINKKIKLIEKEIELLLYQEKNIKNKIAAIKNNISKEEKELDERKIQFEKRAKYLYKKGGSNLLSKLISSDEWNNRLSRIKYYKIILEEEKSIKSSILNSIDNLNIEKENLKKEEKNKKKSIANKNKESKKLKKEKDRKKTYLKEIINDKEKLNIILDSKKNMMSKIEKTIKKLITDKNTAKKIEENLARKRAQQNKSTSGNFAKMKGKLTWPITGKVVSKFGIHTNPNSNTKIENLGIDIKSNKNESINPVLDGVVSIITYNREYGNMMIVSHGGGYHTVYANIENIMVNENDYIQQDTIIGQVAKSNISDNYLLHFQIWKNEEKLNPETWLKK